MPVATTRITKLADICGGDACIEGHRIPVWVLVGYKLRLHAHLPAKAER